MEILLASLAVWRISYMLTVEYGPYDVFERLRIAANPYKWVNLNCLKCMSVWVALPFAFLVGFSFTAWLASSAVAIIINSVIERLED